MNSGSSALLIGPLGRDMPKTGSQFNLAIYRGLLKGFRQFGVNPASGRAPGDDADVIPSARPTAKSSIV